jgi:hypothetical protein
MVAMGIIFRSVVVLRQQSILLIRMPSPSPCTVALRRKLQEKKIRNKSASSDVQYSRELGSAAGAKGAVSEGFLQIHLMEGGAMSSKTIVQRVDFQALDQPSGYFKNPIAK